MDCKSQFTLGKSEQQTGIILLHDLKTAISFLEVDSGREEIGSDFAASSL